ncbi:hypothetical protein B0A63_02850 [Flavobacterium johnsoniae UW101]|nr:hypothetical protein B0A63_02850 [Flavobacterium johnsoniae UW101]
MGNRAGSTPAPGTLTEKLSKMTAFRFLIPLQIFIFLISDYFTGYFLSLKLRFFNSNSSTFELSGN